MMPFSKCPVCGGEMAEKEVEKLLRGGVHVAFPETLSQFKMTTACGPGT